MESSWRLNVEDWGLSDGLQYSGAFLNAPQLAAELIVPIVRPGYTITHMAAFRTTLGGTGVYLGSLLGGTFFMDEIQFKPHPQTFPYGFGVLPD